MTSIADLSVTIQTPGRSVPARLRGSGESRS
jgi:hypothetical protein